MADSGDYAQRGTRWPSHAMLGFGLSKTKMLVAMARSARSRTVGIHGPPSSRRHVAAACRHAHRP